MERCPLCKQPHSLDFATAGRFLALAMAAALPCLQSEPPRAAGIGEGTLAQAERAAIAVVQAELESRRQAAGLANEVMGAAL